MSAAQPGPRPSTRDSTHVDPYEPEYPSGDGEPMAESTTQFRWIVTIKGDGWTSPLLGVTFHAPRRKEALEIVRPDGRPFRSFGELAKDEEAARRIAKTERRRRRQAERQVDAERRLRADAEHQVDALSERVDAERRLREESDARALADRERAERLATRPRERGIDPD